MAKLGGNPAHSAHDHIRHSASVGRHHWGRQNNLFRFVSTPPHPPEQPEGAENRKKRRRKCGNKQTAQKSYDGEIKNVLGAKFVFIVYKVCHKLKDAKKRLLTKQIKQKKSFSRYLYTGTYIFRCFLLLSKYKRTLYLVPNTIFQKAIQTVCLKTYFNS